MYHRKTLPENLKKQIQKLNKFRLPYKVTFFIMGIASTLWFLIRVIPKPSRAAYPCMRAAAPIMSSFIIYLLGISGSALLFKRSKQFFRRTRYILAAAAFTGALVLFAFSSNLIPERLFAANPPLAGPSDFPPNEPMGQERGIFPGRVVWEWDPDATNENCANSYWPTPDAFFMAKNNDQEVINRMTDNIVKKLTGAYDVGTAWDLLFRDFNKRKGRGDAGYQTGEMIFIKINQGAAGWATNPSTLRYAGGGSYPNAETSAAMPISVLRQLVDEYHIPQENIYIGDPNAHILQDIYEQMVALYPDVKYVDKDHSDLGRTLIHKSASPAIHWSDKRSVMDAAGIVDTEYLWEEMENADYLINVAALKAHARAGVTLTAKNHFGSHANPNGAWPLHDGLVCNVDNDIRNPARLEYGMYRVLTDIMGHEKLGGNTVMFFVEGLWGGPEAVSRPVKWNMYPFNGDWPSSILGSQDAVALESVCFDLLKTEFDDPNGIAKARPWYGGVDDHLHQAADSGNWPEGFIYDPEGDGSPIGSMGVHEHWNSEFNMQYSRNLGYNYGIELIAPKELVKNAVQAPEAHTAPAIDGDPSDTCWASAEWYYIDQTWMNWGEHIDSADFFARFKVCWSAEENLLYFLVDVNDDVFVDGYNYPQDGYWNFDVLEVFIDEDCSGGLHAVDNPVAGEKSENAFTYHLTVNAPAEGEVNNSFHAMDLDGMYQIVDYSGNFPLLALKKTGNKYVYEFALAVYNDTYSQSAPEDARVALAGNKLIGLSLAYCDNDQPDGKRDNFFGSVWVPQADSNSHWMDADGYGRLRLVRSMDENHAVQAAGTIDDFTVTELNTGQVIQANLLEVFSDADGDILEYEFDCEQPGLQFSAEGNVLEVTASAGFSGSYDVTVKASDGFSSSAVTFKISSEVNLPVEVTGSIPDLEILHLDTFVVAHANLLEVFSDPNGDVLTFSAESEQAALEFSVEYNALKVKASEIFEGDAEVTVTASDGPTSVSVTFNVSTPSVGIQEQATEPALRCYPNPVTDRFYADVNFNTSYSGPVQARIYDLSGKMILDRQGGVMVAGKGAFTMNLGEVPGGTYILVVRAGKETRSIFITKY
jgi:hypothetical protein